ncbi:MAG: insulinase family protein [Xanthobacteraceae bacterium]|jgi:Zn-dependent M16 (insulinase) family peptidase
MTAVHGFEPLREQHIAEAGSTARLYRHARTGAELLSLANDDENKVFAATFRTPPTDSTGVAHILEHSVLCGSRKYPVRKPFVELKKGSLNTFLNAFTLPDMTCYPVASQNLQDFYNLLDVYLDAVLHPLIDRHTFEQEGWHYELDSGVVPLTYKGVVLNEMKGNYSSPDYMMERLSQASLFPDTPYGLDSGGDPRRIPDLTYQQLKAFHQRHYHPSNARLYFYGDDDPTERLRLLDAWLAPFDPIPAGSGVGLQRRFSAPRRIADTYAAGADDAGPNKAMVTINWMLDEVDVTLDLALTILDYILTGTPASPLRQALIDSGLGDAYTGGLRSHLRQPTYSAGLKGIDPAAAERIETLILETLRDLAANGIDRPIIEAAMNSNEFALRERNTGSFPRGLAVLLTTLRPWLDGHDPLAPIAFEGPLGAIKARVLAGERYFEGLIGRHLIDNAHRTTVVLRPDPEQGDRDAAQERSRLDKVRAAMGPADIAAVVETTSALRTLQQTPDPPEALASIPTLRLRDLPRRDKVIPCVVGETGGTQTLYHDLATNGVVYLDIGLDLHRLRPDLVPYVPLFGRALLQTGAGEQEFGELSRRIDRSTGGIYAAPWTSTMREGPAATAWLVLRGKAVADRTGELLAILADVLMSARLDDRERFRQLVLEAKSSLEASLLPAGTGFVNLRLRAGFDEAHWAEEQMNGISQLFFLRDLARQVEADWEPVRAALERIRRTLVDRATMICNVTADADSIRRLEPKLAGFLDALPLASAEPMHWSVGDRPRIEGLTVPAAVNYVGKGADLHRLGHRPNGASWVVTNHLDTTWLWDKVRVQGGAYGASCHYDEHSGGLTFLSYRDPNPRATLDVFDGSAGFLRAVALDDAELTRNIIGTIGAVDAYMLPDAKGWSSLARHLIGDTEEVLQRRREEILSAGAADFRRFADALDEVAAHGRVVVLGSEQAIAAATAEGTDIEMTRVL